MELSRYHMTPEEVKRWWANKKLLVTNSKTAAPLSCARWTTGRTRTRGWTSAFRRAPPKHLGVEAGDEVDIALADPKSRWDQQ